MAKLVLSGVAKQYDTDSLAVEDFNLEIDQKEFVIFVGPSGCGKSTVLRMIAGLEKLSKGAIYIDEKPISKKMAANGDIAMVFQNYALYPHMTVYDNIAYSLKIKKVEKKIIDKQVHEVAKLLDLGELLDRRPAQLSGGQKQRVAMGRAMIRIPKLFLMDEPLSNLDAKLRTQMRKEILKLYKRTESTFIYVTHDQTEAMTLGTKIVVLNKGKIQQVATPEELYDNPANIFVAGFIGSPQMNFWNAKVIQECEIIKLFIDGMGEYLLPEEQAEILWENNYLGKDIVLGVRPENLILKKSDLQAIEHSGDDTEYGMNGRWLSAVSKVYEMDGAIGYLHLEAKNNSVIIRTKGSEQFDMERITLFWIESSKMHFFDRESGERIK